MNGYVTIPLKPELVALYEQASEADREKAAMLFQTMLEDLIATEEMDSLSAIMDRISDKAEARGLTPEILDELLNDDE